MHPSSKMSSILGIAALCLAVSAPIAVRAQTQDLFVINGFGANTISRFASSGPSTFATTPTTLTIPSLNRPVAITFDARGDLFVANSSGNNIIEFIVGAMPGTFGAVTTLSSPSLSAPQGLAFDTQGDLFTANFSGGSNHIGSITEFAAGTTPGTFGAATTFTDPSLYTPIGVAFNTHGDLFAANESASTITEFAAGTTPGTFGAATVLTDPSLLAPTGIATDARGDLFAANLGTTITEFPVDPINGGFLPGRVAFRGLNGPSGLAFDALGDLFATNIDGGTITEFASTGEGTFGAGTFVETGLIFPEFLAFGPSAPPAVPEASTTVSLGLLLLGMGGLAVAGWRRKA